MTTGLNPSRLVLPNGVTLVSKQTTKTPAVTVSLAFNVGSVDDPPNRAGATFLLSRVIDRGTVSRSAADIADTLDDRGISLGISVSRQQLTISCTCLAVDFEQVLALLGDIVMAPSFPDDELDTRRAQVLTSLRQDEDNPATRAAETFMTLLYGADHAYGRRLKGTAESLGALTRERLLALHGAKFGPTSLTAVVVGDVERARCESCVAAVFGGWSAPVTDRSALPSPTLPSERRFVAVPMMNKAQADIVYGFPSLKRSDPSYYAYVLMNNVLGQYGLGGRLGDSIRERQGMAYYVSSAFDASKVEGPMLIRAGVAASNVERAIASIDEELHSLRKTGVTGRELAESRQYLTGSLPLSLETNAGIAAFLQNAEFFGLGLDHDRRLPTLLTMVTIDEVNAAAQALDPDRATIAVAGPYQPA